MKLLQLLLLTLLLPALLQAQELRDNFTLVLHGGAGNITKDNVSPERKKAVEAAMQEALATGHAILAAGGTAVEAVEKSIRILENSPEFNAGKGAVFASDGTNQLDASIMDGSNREAGGVAGVRTVKNPISAARLVMEKSPHVLLSGTGADQFARDEGLEIVEPDYFRVESRFRRYQQAQEKDQLEQKLREQMNPSGKDRGYIEPTLGPNDKYGTVGAVAIDRHGNMAAGTSTGGMNFKKYGRIGDSPLIGAGTYANNETCAVSCTGHGEYFIRAMVAYDMSALVEYDGNTVEEAAYIIIHEKLPGLGGKGGLISVDDKGEMVADFNTAGMFRATINQTGWGEIGMFEPGTEEPFKLEAK